MNSKWMVGVAPVTQAVPVSSSTPPHSQEPETACLDQLVEKLAMAERLGQELAHRNPNLLEKSAMLGAAVGALGAAAPKLLNAGRSVAGTMMRSPTKALALGGAAAGGLAGAAGDPGFDAQGNRGSRIGNALSGAAVGGALGFGASRIPGAGKAVQQGGKALSQQIRGNHWQNANYSKLPGVQKVAGLLQAAGGVAKGLAGNPAARRVAAGGALGAASGGEEHHMSGALTGALLSGAAGGFGAAPRTASLPAPGFLSGAPRLSPLVSQGRPVSVPPGAVQRMKARAAGAGNIAPAAPDAPDGFGMARTSKRAPVDPHAATAMRPGGDLKTLPGAVGAPQTKADPKTHIGLGRTATSVTRVDPSIRNTSMKQLVHGAK